MVTNGKRACTVAAGLVVAAVCGSVSEAGTIEKIERYCRTSWRNAGIHQQEWSDCTQQALHRLLERVRNAGLEPAINVPDSPERRELNRSIWATVQRWRRRPRTASLNDDAQDMTDERGDRNLQHKQAYARTLLASPEISLTNTQRRILSLWLDGRSVAEIGRHLGMPAPRVSDQKYKAIAKLREHCRAVEA